MIVKAIYKDNNFDYFRDKTTAEKIEDQIKRHYGDIFECDDELAEERIEKGLVKKATPKEEKKYYDSIGANADNNIKPLEELTIEELKEITVNENIEITEEATKEELIDTINKVRAERLEQSKGSEE